MQRLLLFLALIPGMLFAQKTKLDNDTIFKGDVPYGILIKTSGLPAIYSIRTLNNTEVAVSKLDADAKDAAGRDYHRVTFLGSGAIGHFPNQLKFGQNLAEAIVECNLLNDSAVNPEGEKKFLALYPSRVKTQPTVVVNVNNSPDYTTVERNRNMPIFVNGGTISQASVNIGTCTSTSDLANGKSMTVIKYYLPNGVQCAEARCETHMSSTATVTTLKDNRTHSVTITNAATKEQTIAKWLVDNFYM